MTRRFALALRFLCIPAALTSLAVMPAFAANARSFAGSYQLTKVVEDGSQVHLTMVLTLFNGSTHSVKGGIVTVMDSQPAPALLGSFGAIKALPSLQQVTVSHALTIPAREYAEWLSGHAPRLQFLVPATDADGQETATAEDIQSHQVVLPAKATN